MANVSKKQKEVAVDEAPRETTVEFLASLAGVLVTGLFIITFILQAFEIPSCSMEDTLAHRRPRVCEPGAVRHPDALDGAADALSRHPPR